jgi:glycerol-3-phosphate dehydrogenase
VNRDQMLAAASDRSVVWDIIVIGGGATGLGIAVDAATRGYRTLLLEKGDFANATSSRSTKLIHGGVRYLQQGNIKLVREALRERGLLLRNAPHLVHPQRFVIPNANRWESVFYGTGLKIYDAMSGRYGLGRTEHLSREQTFAALPTLKRQWVKGGTAYVDGQFDDARLAITLALTAAEAGATLLNYAAVVAILKENGRTNGIVARDLESDNELSLRAKAVINATGVFADEIRKLDEATAVESVSPSQGAHIVLPKTFLPGESALMIPKTDDGRVLFAIPWHGRVLVGTTDTARDRIEAAPQPLDSELEFLLTHAGRYLEKGPGPADVLCTFAGLRPLAKASTRRNSALIPRDHHISVSQSGIVTVTGGKWTTYRRMAKDAVDRSARVAGLVERGCQTEALRLHGADEKSESAVTPYGTDNPAIQQLISANPKWGTLLHPKLPYVVAEGVWGVRREMARTVEDVLARRTRALFLDVRASIEAAPHVAELLSKELNRSREWAESQISQFVKAATRYIPG